MFEVGRICMKVAGRDAGKRCVIIDVLDDKFVMIDGQTRRRKCNMLHLELLKQTIKIQKNASHDKVVSELKKAGIEVREPEKKKEKKQKSAKPKKTKANKKTTEKTKETTEKEPKKTKKADDKKASKKETTKKTKTQKKKE